MTIIEELKKEIDEMSYEELLRNWRFAPTGSPYFSSEVWEHYAKVMEKQRKKIGPAAHIAASKAIGWEP